MLGIAAATQGDAVNAERLKLLQYRFFHRVMGGAGVAETEVITASAAEKALFDFAASLREHFPPAGETKGEAVPEAALIEAIGSMAEFGAEQAFAGMKPRLRRAVRKRIATMLKIVLAKGVSADAHVAEMPRGLPAHHLGMALLLTLGVEIPADVRTKLE